MKDEKINIIKEMNQDLYKNKNKINNLINIKNKIVSDLNIKN